MSGQARLVVLIGMVGLGSILAGCSAGVVHTLPSGSVSLTEPATTPKLELGQSRVYTFFANSDQTGPLRALAVPKSRPQDSQLQLTLYNSDYQPLARSVSRYWFGLPQVALLGITVDPLDAYRINFRAEAGRTYYLRVTNGGDAAQQVQLSLELFRPNANTDTLLGTGQSLKGVIEFLGQFDSYQLGSWKLTDRYYLHLDYNGPIDLVGYVYTGQTPQQKPRYIMEPQRNNCAPASDGEYVVVRDRSGARAGFDEPGSGRYTLSLNQTACP